MTYFSLYFITLQRLPSCEIVEKYGGIFLGNKRFCNLLSISKVLLVFSYHHQPDIGRYAPTYQIPYLCFYVIAQGNSAECIQ